MARRSDHSRDELRQMILHAVRKIVVTEGRAALTARRIAEEIGYSPGTLYNVFADLDEIILTVNAETLDQLDLVLRSVGGTPGASMVVGFAQAYVGFVHGHAPLWQLAFEHTLPAGYVVPAWLTERIERLFGRLEAGLAPMFPDPAQRRRAARVLWCGVHGICLLSLSGKMDLIGTDTTLALAENLVKSYLKGAAPGPA